jgi:uncharacterized protein (DUF4415 family)
MPNAHHENEKQRIAQARADEKRRREAAQAETAEVQPGGHEVAGRTIKQMVSVRLEAQLVKDLRELAEHQNMSISDLLRQAAVELVGRSRSIPLLVRYRRPEAALFSALSGVVPTALTAGMQVSSGGLTTEDAVSGNDSACVLSGW